jgi:hypothetical protein
MLYNFKVIEIFSPALVLSSLLLVLLRSRIKKKGGAPLSQALSDFKLTTLVFGGLVPLLCFLLVPAMLAGGLPKDSATLQDEKLAWYFIRSGSQASERTAQVVMWFLFLFVFWFLPAVYKVIKALGEQHTDYTAAKGS